MIYLRILEIKAIAYLETKMISIIEFSCMSYSNRNYFYPNYRNSVVNTLMIHMGRTSDAERRINLTPTIVHNRLSRQNLIQCLNKWIGIHHEYHIYLSHIYDLLRVYM